MRLLGLGGRSCRCYRASVARLLVLGSIGIHIKSLGHEPSFRLLLLLVDVDPSKEIWLLLGRWLLRLLGRLGGSERTRVEVKQAGLLLL